VRLVENPKDTAVVGGDGVIKILMKRVAPGLEERIAARQLQHTTQMEQAPPAPDSPVAVRAPIPHGTEVSAGRRKAS
jgi:hypothetical protein